MADRVTVELCVLTEHAKRAEEIIGEPAEESMESVDCTWFVYHEVNYGVLNRLDRLRAAGIAYESSWDSGAKFSKGCCSLRFTPEGEAIEKEIYENEMGINVEALLEVIEDHELLKQRINDHAERVSVLPWDNQAHYGKLYMARQLVCPQKD